MFLNMFVSGACSSGANLGESRVGSGGGYPARSVLLFDVPGDTDVSVLSPGISPGVLDLPEVVSGVGSVSNGKNSVVEAGSGDGGHDSPLVKLPVEVSINSDGDGLLGDSGSEGVLVVSNVGVGDALSSGDGGAAGDASGIGSGGGGVRVVVLSAETIGCNVLEGVVHESSVASHVTVFGVAGDELLLGEGDGVSVLLEVSSLHSTGGGEGPAGSAGSLVLDVGDVSGPNPVNGIVGLYALEGVDIAGSLFPGGRLGKVKGLELVEGEVGELVVSEGVGGVSGVVDLDDVGVLGEDGESLGELLARLDLEAMLSDVVDKVSLVLLTGVHKLRVGNGSGKSE